MWISINCERLNLAPKEQTQTCPSIYVLGHKSGIVKVGLSSSPTQRLGALKRAARQLGDDIPNAWVSEPHPNARSNERKLIEHCRATGKLSAGTERGEYFRKVSFDSVVEFAKELEKQPVPAAQDDDDGLCEACRWLEKSPVTWHWIFNEIVHGRLRLTDPVNGEVIDPTFKDLTPQLSCRYDHARVCERIAHGAREFANAGLEPGARLYYASGPYWFHCTPTMAVIVRSTPLSIAHTSNAGNHVTAYLPHPGGDALLVDLHEFSGVRRTAVRVAELRGPWSEMLTATGQTEQSVLDRQRELHSGTDANGSLSPSTALATTN
jgi:hypothetical protein